MRTAVLALFLSVGIVAVLALASFFGYDVPFIDVAQQNETSTISATQKAAAQNSKLIAVPSGTFVGPTGQPTIKGPSGPPPDR
jgi:hypothetical protein